MFALFEDDSTIIMGDRRLRSLRLLNQRLWIFALFLLWQATKSSARTITCKQAQEGETDCPYCLYCLKNLRKQKAQENGKCGHLVIWSFGHFDVFKENEKGTEGKKKTKETKKKVNIKKLKL